MSSFRPTPQSNPSAAPLLSKANLQNTKFEVRRAKESESVAVSQMLELYQHDLSDIWDQELDSEGRYGYSLDRSWTRTDCHAFVVLVEGHYAGFALVDRATKVQGGGYWMDQFFIVKKHRRSGAGRILAIAAFAALPGYWEVGQMPANHAAQAFWRRVIGSYTDGVYAEQTLTSGWWQGLVQCFKADVCNDA